MAAPRSGRTAKKLPDERMGHRTAAELATVTTLSVSAEAPAPVIPDPDPDWHHAARQVWDAFVTSPIAHLWESTDYAAAWVTCGAIDKCVQKGYSPTLLMTVRSMMNDLMLTEAARRAANIAITRTPPVENPAAVAAIEAVRNRGRTDD